MIFFQFIDLRLYSNGHKVDITHIVAHIFEVVGKVNEFKAVSTTICIDITSQKKAN